ncbi:hypothetical protein P691DRAFT_771276 [Macrolepiota fuliginosa MF-IS2]|uniref:Uncharacterized protein n=1 Tax=Macrolepiota fuliginosa MF-IS2 TaxID=1400762 RepID=A0A9P6CA18_9AGAR|nr:hypothetical protein P691DRAFT_771276 [Macrolepiota fuliginosa MF-IS2]
MQLKPSFVLLVTLASAGTISALPVDGATEASDRASDIGVDRAVSMGFDRQARGFYEGLDACDVLEELQTRDFDDLEIRELDYLEGLEARAQSKISKMPKPRPPRPISAKRHAQIGGRPKPGPRPGPKPPTPNPGPKPGPSIEINPSIPIDPWQFLNQNQQQQPSLVAQDVEGRAPRGGRPRPGSKPNTKPGTPGRPGIEINPGIGIPIDPFQILNPGQPAPAIMIPRRAGGGQKLAPKPGPKPGPKPATKPPGGGPRVNPPTIGIEPIIPLPPLFPPALPAPTLTA